MQSSNFPLTDLHCHLQDSRFDHDIDAVVERAKSVGVRRFVCNASQPSDWQKTHSIAERFPDVIPCFGLHPLYVDQVRQQTHWLDLLTEMLTKTADSKTWLPAVGEIGLDHYVEPRDDHLQETVFREQLRLASKLRRPVMLHTRHSLDRVVEVLLTEKRDIPVVLCHGFGSSTERVRQIVELDGYFSFSANLLKSNHKKARIAAAAVPLDRILLESDAPDMPPPTPMIPKNWPTTDGHGIQVRNEPSILPAVLIELATIRQIPVATLANVLCENETIFFKKWAAASNSEA